MLKETANDLSTRSPLNVVQRAGPSGVTAAVVNRARGRARARRVMLQNMTWERVRVSD